MFERRRMHTQTDVTKNIWEIEKRVCRHFFLEDLSDKHPVRSTRTCSLSSIFWNSSPDLQQNHFLRSLVLEGEKKERIPLFIRLSRVFFLSCLTKKKRGSFPWGDADKEEEEDSYPTTNGGMRNGSSVGIHAHSIHVFARLATICMLSRCLVNFCIGA